MTTEVTAPQYEKAPYPIDVTELGMATEVSAPQYEKAPLSIDVIV